jgi:hypothetical protein
MAHKDIINSAVIEQFTSLEMPDPARPMRSHLPDSANVRDQGTFLDMLLKDSNIDGIVANTISTLISTRLYTQGTASGSSN